MNLTKFKNNLFVQNTMRKYILIQFKYKLDSLKV